MPKRKSDSPRGPLLHQSISEYVGSLVRSGEYQNQMLPTDGQLMRRFNASRSTVGKAMRELEISGLIERRQGKGSFVRNDQQKNNPLFSVVVAAPGDMEFYDPFCSAIADECYRNKYGLFWGSAPHPNPGEMTKQFCRDWGRRLVDQRVTGVFFVPGELPEKSQSNPNLLFLEQMTQNGLHIVLLDRDYVDFPEEGNYDTVSVNNFHAGYTQTCHLIERGCRRIVYISRPGMLSSKTARIAGYLYALLRAGITVGPELIFRDAKRDERFYDRLLAAKPDGIVCFCDPIAANLICALLKRGIDVPRQIKVIGIDDVNYSRLIQVPLTSLRQPCADIGRLALQMMEERIRNPSLPPRHIQLAARLVERASTEVKS